MRFASWKFKNIQYFLCLLGPLKAGNQIEIREKMRKKCSFVKLIYFWMNFSRSSSISHFVCKEGVCLRGLRGKNVPLGSILTFAPHRWRFDTLRPKGDKGSNGVYTRGGGHVCVCGGGGTWTPQRFTKTGVTQLKNWKMEGCHKWENQSKM